MTVLNSNNCYCSVGTIRQFGNQHLNINPYLKAFKGCKNIPSASFETTKTKLGPFTHNKTHKRQDDLSLFSSLTMKFSGITTFPQYREYSTLGCVKDILRGRLYVSACPGTKTQELD